jgi:hypothetical protein
MYAIAGLRPQQGQKANLIITVLVVMGITLERAGQL